MPTQMPKLSDQEQKVEDALIAMHVTYNVKHLGAGTEVSADGHRWEHDRWEFDLVRRDGNANFSKRVAELLGQEYRTGVGLRKFPKGYMAPRPPYTRNTLAWEQEQRLKQAVVPTIAGLLHSLFLDASGAEQTFEDWCSDYGGDSDSIRSLETYRACQKTLNDLRRFFTREQRAQLENLLEGY